MNPSPQGLMSAPIGTSIRCTTEIQCGVFCGATGICRNRAIARGGERESERRQICGQAGRLDFVAAIVVVVVAGVICVAIVVAPTVAPTIVVVAAIIP